MSEEKMNTDIGGFDIPEFDGGVETLDLYSDQTEKKGFSLNGVLEYIETEIFGEKTRKIISHFFSIIFVLLGVVQLVSWGLTVKDTYFIYVSTALSFDYLGIALIILDLAFVVALIMNIFGGIVDVVKGIEEPRVGIPTTLFALLVYQIFAASIFTGKISLFADFGVDPVLSITVILLLGYSVIRLVRRDFFDRIIPLGFGIGAGVLALVMYTSCIGNIASYSIYGTGNISVSVFNSLEYILSAFGISGVNVGASEMVSTSEEIFLIGCGQLIDTGRVGLQHTVIVGFLQLIPILVADILPFAALSMLGYFAYCIASPAYMQYYKLETCRKMAINTLAAAICSIVITVATKILCEKQGSAFTVELNIPNMLITLLTLAGMILLTSAPWKIYCSINEKRYENMKHSEGGRK